MRVVPTMDVPNRRRMEAFIPRCAYTNTQESRVIQTSEERELAKCKNFRARPLPGTSRRPGSRGSQVVRRLGLRPPPPPPPPASSRPLKGGGSTQSSSPDSLVSDADAAVAASSTEAQECNALFSPQDEQTLKSNSFAHSEEDVELVREAVDPTLTESDGSWARLVPRCAYANTKESRNVQTSEERELAKCKNFRARPLPRTSRRPGSRGSQVIGRLCLRRLAPPPPPASSRPLKGDGSTQLSSPNSPLSDADTAGAGSSTEAQKSNALFSLQVEQTLKSYSYAHSEEGAELVRETIDPILTKSDRSWARLVPRCAYANTKESRVIQTSEERELAKCKNFRARPLPRTSRRPGSRGSQVVGRLGLHRPPPPPPPPSSQKSKGDRSTQSSSTDPSVSDANAAVAASSKEAQECNDLFSPQDEQILKSCSYAPNSDSSHKSGATVPRAEEPAATKEGGDNVEDRSADKEGAADDCSSENEAYGSGSEEIVYTGGIYISEMSLESLHPIDEEKRLDDKDIRASAEGLLRRVSAAQKRSINDERLESSIRALHEVQSSASDSSMDCAEEEEECPIRVSAMRLLRRVSMVESQRAGLDLDSSIKVLVEVHASMNDGDKKESTPPGRK